MPSCCGTRTATCTSSTPTAETGTLRRQFLRWLACWALLILAAPAALAADRFDAWPDPAGVHDITPVTVELRSSDPFMPSDIGRAKLRTVRALLYLPPGASAAHRVPAVVLLHGSLGNVAERGYRYGLPLAAAGIAVLVPETYGSRADLATSFIGRALHITETMFDADAYAGLRFLSSRPDIEPGHVALVGFSYGGMAATYALYDTVARRLAPDGQHFAAHVAFYGPCIARFRDSRTTGAPLLMLYGGQDQLIDPERCAQVADDLRGGGSPVQVVDYRDAVHQWDGELDRQLIGRHLAACRFTVDRFGVVHDGTNGMAMSDPLFRGLALALCTEDRPYPIGRDDAVVKRSDRDLLHFLSAAFARPAG
ncbi:MAG: dienelactone hydrolase family protein [Gluconacetobacter diazotrophicus]|nr:dienelactone hydrolase family protein [Gluconacetobacter diazotrophicus]